MFISENDILALHKKYAPCQSVYDLVLTHCYIIRDIALQLIEKNELNLNLELVKAGALLHDIGVHPLFGNDGKILDGVNYITHGTEGEKILKSEGMPEELVRFAAHHTGVGLTERDVIEQKLPMPVRDYLAETDEELLIMYADKFHSKTTPPYFNSYDWYRNDVSKFGNDKVVKFDAMAVKFGKPDLKFLASTYQYEIR